jgi:hypothetical protein
MGKWIELIQVVAASVGVVALLFGWPLRTIISGWAKERDSAAKKIEELEKKSYESEKFVDSRLSQHDVVLAKLESGKVSHEQLREVVSDLRETVRMGIESISNKWDNSRREDKDDLKETLDEIKDELKHMRNK